MSKPELTLIKSKDPLAREGSNFWKTCPRMLEYLPESECELGKLEKDKSGRYIVPKCAWWIRSEEHHNCFWRFVQSKSTADGIMEELSLAEISRLFGWSSSKINEYYKEAIEELKVALEDYEVDQFLMADDGNL